MSFNLLLSTIIYISTSISLFLLMLDSGGENNLRPIALIFIILAASTQLTSKKSNFYTLTYLTLGSIILASALKSAISGIQHIQILIWILPLLSMPFLIMFCNAVKINSSHFINAGFVFSVLITILFFGRLTGNPVIMQINEYLTSNASGFFNNKKAFFSEAMPVVYFQGTLNLVFIGVLAFGRGRYLVFSSVLLALIVAPSRFGVAILLLFSLIFLITKRYNLTTKKASILLTPLSIFFVIIFLIMNIQQNNIQLHEGFDPVRIGHIDSISSILNDNPTDLIIGNGPGSTFFSSGFNDVTDNIEISQLEILRKYGIIFFIFLHLFFMIVLRKLAKQNRTEITFALTAHYFVSLSNPVLFSIPFLIFFAFAMKEVGLIKTKRKIFISKHNPKNLNYIPNKTDSSVKN